MNALSEKIIILSQTAGSAYFVVDKNETSVSLQYNNNGVFTGMLHDGYDRNLFEKGTNINLLSIRYALPFGFEFENITDGSSYFSKIFLNYVENNVLTNIHKIIMPFSNFEETIGAFLNLAPLGKQMHLTAHFNLLDLPKILMRNVPSDFDGLTFFVPISIKIQSNYDLIEI